MKSLMLKNLLVFIIFFAMVSWLAATERYEQSRIVYSFSHSEFQDYSDSTSMTYEYQTDEPLLLDSMYSLWIMHSNSTYAWIESLNFYINTIQYSGDSIWIDYRDYDSYGPADTYLSHVSYTLDNLGRTVSYQKEIWNDASHTYDFSFRQFRHYNNEGYVDSMFVEGQHQRYFKRIFTDAMLQSTTVYVLNNGVWTPEQRYSYTYPNYPDQYPAPLRFDNYTTQTGEYVFEWETVFNPLHRTSSIVREDWANESWVETIYVSYEAFYNQNNGITLSKEEGNRLDCLVANFTGDITEKSSDYSGLIKNTSYTWDTITPNEDNIVTSVGIAVSVYPNPFYNHLSITFESKDSAPADFSIYNLKGQLVYHWPQQTAGQFSWDGRDRDNQAVATGVYFLRVKQGSATTIRKFIKLK